MLIGIGIGIGFGSKPGVSAETVNLVIFAGQSNMIGWGLAAADLPANLETAPDQYIWNGDAFEALVNGSNNGEITSDGEQWGPEAEFGRQWAAENPDVPLYIVKYAEPSTSLAVDWASGGTQRTTLTAEVAAAIAALEGQGYIVNVAGCFWMQGEEDADDETEANAYAVNLAAFIAYVRSTLGISTTPFVLGRIFHSSGSFRDAVREAQVSVALATTRCRVIDTDDYSGDGLHYDEDGIVDLGTDMWAAYQHIVTTDVTAPTVSALSPLDNATDVAVTSSFEATFSENVKFGASVEIELRLVADDSVVEAWDEGDIGSGISIAWNKLTINPASDMANSTAHYIHIASGSIVDLNDVSYAGLTGTAWSVTTESGAAWHPDVLFGSGEDGFIWDATDTSTLFQERTGGSATTPADSVDEPVGTIIDLSPNDFHGTAAGDSARPLVKAGYILFDGSNDQLSSNFSGLASSPAATLGARVRATSQTGQLLSNFGTGVGLGLWFEFDGGNPPHTNAGTPTSRLNGSSFTGHRGDLWTALIADDCTFVMEGIDIASWADGANVPGSATTGMRLMRMVYIDRALDSGELTNLETWLGQAA